MWILRIDQPQHMKVFEVFFNKNSAKFIFSLFLVFYPINRLIQDFLSSKTNKFKSIKDLKKCIIYKKPQTSY